MKANIFKSFLLLIGTFLLATCLNFVLLETSRAYIRQCFIWYSILEFQAIFFWVGITLLFFAFTPLVIFFEKYIRTKKENLLIVTSFEHILISLLAFVLWNKTFIEYLINHIYLVGALTLYVLLSGCLGFIRFSNRRKDGENLEVDLLDTPIEKAENDALDRMPFVEGFAKQVTTLAFNKSFVIGLYGRWGEGKTSVLNLLQERIEENKNTRFLIVRFEPWFFSDEEAITKSLYGHIENVLENRYILPGIRSVFNKYMKITSCGISASPFSINFPVGVKESVNVLKRKIEGYLSQINKKLIIMIDDIDRLDANEISQVLKLVRLNASFKDAFFILSMDHSVTASKLDSVTENNGARFIEKIVEKPVVLPKCEQGHIDRFLYFSAHEIPKNEIKDLSEDYAEEAVSFSGVLVKNSKGEYFVKSFSDPDEKCRIVVGDYDKKNLDKLIDEKVFVKARVESGDVILGNEGKVVKYRLSMIDLLFRELYEQDSISISDINQFDKNMDYTFRAVFSKRIQTLRDAKRFMNSLSSSLPAVVGEVNLFDYIVLEFIKVFYPKLYDDIYENWWIYSDQRYRNEVWTNPHLFSNNEEEKQKQIKEHISNLFNDIRVDKSEIETIIHLLSELFDKCKNIFNKPRHSQDRLLSIDSDHFAKYYLMKVPSDDISDTFVTSAIKLWAASSEPKKEIESVIKDLRGKGKLIDFLESIQDDHLDKITPEIATYFVRAISENSLTFSQESVDGPWRSEFTKGEGTILKLLDRKFSGNELIKQIEAVLLESPDIYLACALLLQMRQDRDGSIYNIYKTVDHPALCKKMSEHLKRHFIDQGRSIFQEFSGRNGLGLVCHQWASNWGNDNSNKTLVTQYLVDLMRDNIRNFYDFMLRYKIERVVPPSDGEIRINAQDIAATYDFRPILDVAKKYVESDEPNQKTRRWIKEFIKNAEDILN